MSDLKILRGWGEIEAYTREGRNTLIRKGYPINKDNGGAVWANPLKIDEHRLSISVQMCSNVSISVHDPATPL